MEQPAFSGDAAADYAPGPARQVPGFADLHRMMTMLLAEKLPDTGRVLVHGAGGGLELRSLAAAHPGWTFDGVDPSADMLEAARHTAAPHTDRITLHHGYIDAAPDGPFNAATSLLTFHFIARDQRLETLTEIRRRLRPGAPFVLAHISFPQTEPERSTWITRHVAFGAAAGTDPARIARSEQAISERLTILSPTEEEDLLKQAGFTDVSLFYAGLGFRGWIAYAA